MNSQQRTGLIFMLSMLLMFVGVTSTEPTIVTTMVALIAGVVFVAGVYLFAKN